MPTQFDTVIIGGGFAGLSAGIYTSRSLRSTLIIDNQSGRWKSHERNQNYFGFPDGIATKDLHERGLTQAIRFGCKIAFDTTTQLSCLPYGFQVTTIHSSVSTRSIILSPGVTDQFPHFPHWELYLGKSLFWCITCDGYKTKGKHVAVIGTTDEAACTASQFLIYTPHVSFITNSDTHKISYGWIRRFQKMHIPFYLQKIKKIEGKQGIVKDILLFDGKNIPTNVLFSEHAVRPNSSLATRLGIRLSSQGYILTDLEQRTNIPFVYAAGDVTKLFNHQIVTAVHEGATSAQSAHYDLFPVQQREM